MPIPERIERKIKRTAKGCWLWTASVQSGGYPQVKWGGTMRLTHRVLYEIEHGEIPLGRELHHLCRDQRCVNPEHLEPLRPYQHGQRHRRE